MRPVEPARPLERSIRIDGFHVVGAIQPHGIVVVVRAQTLHIDAVSDNVEILLGCTPRELCNAPLATLLTADAHGFCTTLREPGSVLVTPIDLALRGHKTQRLDVECTVHRLDDERYVLEFEPRDETPAANYDRVQAAIERLWRAGDIPALIDAGIADLCAISGFDRVEITRFKHDDQSGVNERPTAASELTAAERRLYGRAPLLIVPDSHCVQSSLVTPAGTAPREPIDLSRATLRTMTVQESNECRRLGSRAFLQLPIVVRGRLWGLVRCHHDQPRRLAYRTRALCELLVQMLVWQLDARMDRVVADDAAGAVTSRMRSTAPSRFPAADPTLDRRKEQAAGLIRLHNELAAALPSRATIVDSVLAFTRRETGADGSAMELLDGSQSVCEAGTGMLGALAGVRSRRAGTIAGLSADIHSPLVCNDIERDLDPTERSVCERFGIESIVVVPIAMTSTTTIVLKAVSTVRHAFGEEDIATLRLAATNLLTALHAAERFSALVAAEHEQRTYARQLRALHAIASTTTSNRKDQIDAALALGLEQLELDWGFLGVIDDAAQEFIFENSVCRDGECIVAAGVRTPLGGTIVGRLRHGNGVRIVQDVAQLDEPPAFGGWASYIGVPLYIGGVQYGVIGFTSREIRSGRFSAANTEFVAVAGDLIASAIERGLQREALETSETRYRALTEAIPEMVWVVDNDNRFAYVNASWTNYTGLTLEQTIACGYEGIYDVAQLPMVNAKRSALPRAEFNSEVRLRRYDGSYRWHLVRNVPFRDAAGEWLVTATDIEDRKSAEALMADVHGAALAATEAKSRFLATMSHEIRTPMNAVMGMTELLLLTQLSQEQREYIEIVRDSGQSLLRVLNDILDYSKIEAGKFELETVDFDLRGQISSVVELLHAQFQIKGVRLTTRIDTGVPPIVTGDPGRLRQILLNLAGNALKFTPEGGAVRITVDTAATTDDAVPLRFAVADTGIGMPPDVVKRLFQPFSQGDESTTRKYGGTGLGLSICAQLVALMNGTVGVESAPGEGSSFWFEISLRSAKQSLKAHGARERVLATSRPVVMRAEKILLVEDNEINTFLALKQLQRIGFIVSAVNNGQQAVDAVSREQFDFVFMDCHMPEMDGFAATREIRRLEAGGARRLPIVAMTADARTEDHQNCLRAGMDDYVSKPTSLDSLRTVLDRWLPTPDRRLTNRNGSARSSTRETLAVSTLLDLFGGDRAAVMTLLSAAAGAIRADFARIENCAAAHDFTAVAEAAHRLKGTSASIRATLLGEVSAAVERAAHVAAEPIAEGLLSELRGAVEALIADVETHGKLLATIG